MIDPLQPASIVVTSFMAVSSFVAPDDLTLRQAIFTTWQNEGPFNDQGLFILTADPDQVPGEAGVGFQLAGLFDPEQFSRIAFSDLVVPVLKESTLYWKVEATNVIVQLIFS